MTAAGAIRLARRLEPYDPLWFEEPVPPDAPEQMAKVARATSIPIATGERLATKYDFARLLQADAAAILQMNLGRVGGMLEAKKIAGMAEVHHVQIAPHLYCGPVVGAANIQLATCSPNFLILEGIERWDGFHAEVLKKPIRWQDGLRDSADEPGLGVELNEAVIAQHPYNGQHAAPGNGGAAARLAARGRALTTSSSVPVRPAVWWRAGSVRIARGACWCSKPAARTDASGSSCRSAMGAPSTTRASTGCMRGEPIRRSRAAARSGRAARCSAGRDPSMPWSMRAACRRTSMTGATSAIPAGRFTTCCPLRARRGPHPHQRCLARRTPAVCRPSSTAAARSGLALSR